MTTSTPASASAATRSSVSGEVPTGGADAQRAARVLACGRILRRLLEVLHGDHAAQLEALVDDEHLLDAVLVQEAQHLLLARALAHRDEAVARRHDGGHRRVEVRLEAQVAVRDDADRLPAVHDGHAGDALGASERDDVADRRIRRHRDRVADDAALELLDALDFARLGLGRHALVDDADAAFLRERDREAGLRDGIHRRRDEGHVQADAAGQLGREIDVARQHLRVGGQQQDVVEGEGFTGEAHGGF
jgi:hypothetical protein